MTADITLECDRCGEVYEADHIIDAFNETVRHEFQCVAENGGE